MSIELNREIAVNSKERGGNIELNIIYSLCSTSIIKVYNTVMWPYVYSKMPMAKWTPKNAIRFAFFFNQHTQHTTDNIEFHCACYNKGVLLLWSIVFDFYFICFSSSFMVFNFDYSSSMHVCLTAISTFHVCGTSVVTYVHFIHRHLND